MSESKKTEFRIQYASNVGLDLKDLNEMFVREGENVTFDKVSLCLSDEMFLEVVTGIALLRAVRNPDADLRALTIAEIIDAHALTTAMFKELGAI